MHPWLTFALTIGIIVAASVLALYLEERERRRLEEERKKGIAKSYDRSRVER